MQRRQRARLRLAPSLLLGQPTVHTRPPPRLYDALVDPTGSGLILFPTAIEIHMTLAAGAQATQGLTEARRLAESLLCVL
jgi:hypothetical protein